MIKDDNRYFSLFMKNNLFCYIKIRYKNFKIKITYRNKLNHNTSNMMY